MYTHCTFNLNPRAPFHRHAAALLRSGKVRGPHASERGHRHRGVGELREADPGNFRRRNDLRRGSGPGFELGLAMQEICKENPKAKAIIMGQHGLIQLGRRRQGMLRALARFDRKSASHSSRQNTRQRAATRRPSAARNIRRSRRKRRDEVVRGDPAVAARPGFAAEALHRHRSRTTKRSCAS